MKKKPSIRYIDYSCRQLPQLEKNKYPVQGLGPKHQKQNFCKKKLEVPKVRLSLESPTSFFPTPPTWWRQLSKIRKEK